MQFDMQDAFILISIIDGIVCFWTMQCITVHAGLRDGRRFAILALRFSLALLALAVFANAADCYKDGWYPNWIGLTTIIALLGFLITLPFAIGGRAGVALAARIHA